MLMGAPAAMQVLPGNEGSNTDSSSVPGIPPNARHHAGAAAAAPRPLAALLVQSLQFGYVGRQRGVGGSQQDVIACRRRRGDRGGSSTAWSCFGAAAGAVPLLSKAPPLLLTQAVLLAPSRESSVERLALGLACGRPHPGSCCRRLCSTSAAARPLCLSSHAAAQPSKDCRS